jgi:hypothetical protein
MKMKHIVRLSGKERQVCQDVVKNLKGTSQKVRRAQALLKTDADGPACKDAEFVACMEEVLETYAIDAPEDGEGDVSERDSSPVETKAYAEHFGRRVFLDARHALAPGVGVRIVRVKAFSRHQYEPSTSALRDHIWTIYWFWRKRKTRVMQVSPWFSISGRYWTRTNDLHDVNVAL